MRVSLAVAIACLGAMGVTQAQEAKAAIRKQTSIPAQDLRPALQQLSKARDLQLVFRTDVVGELKTNGAAGNLTQDEAFDALLNGTGLTFRYLDEKTVTILPVVSGGGGNATKSNATSSNAKEAQKDPSFWGRFRLAQVDQRATSSAAAVGSSSPRTGDSSATLEEIVVTAERRAESIQDLPIAISAFSGETLTDRGIVGLESLQQISPSLQVLNRGSDGEARVAMRGVSTEIAGVVTEPTVALTRDGVAFASPALFAGDFYDVERVEVLRGPQGTISGRNATAGAIHIHSKRPTESFEGGVTATLGNYEQIGLEGFLSGPIVEDRLLARLAVRTERADGWVTNTLLGQELSTIDRVQARASFLARFSEDFEALLTLEGLQDRSDYFVNAYVDEGRLRADTPTLTEELGVSSFDEDRDTIRLSNRTINDKERYQATLRLAWDLGPSARLTAITAYIDQDQPRFDHDNDGTSETLIVHNKVTNNLTQLSQEITLTADVTDRLDMILGGLYMDLDPAGSIDLSVPAVEVAVVDVGGQNLKSWAGYTQWRYRLTDTVRLTAGARYTHDTKEVVSEGTTSIGNPPFLVIPTIVDGEGTWSAWTPRVAVDYAPNKDLTMYVSASRGFKSGGLKGRGVGQPMALYAPEFVWNYEAGVKANGWDGRLSTALTGFYMDYTDLQQLLYFFDPIANTIRDEITNAEAATIYGVELELEALLTDRFRVTFAGTWLDATYDELSNVDTLFPEIGAPLPQDPGGPNVRDLSGNRVVRAPEWQFNLSGEYRVPLPGTLGGSSLQAVLRASYAYQGQVYFDTFNRESVSQDAYGLINLSGAIETSDGRWQLSAFVRNLTDEHYLTHKQAVIGLTDVPYVVGMIGDARRYGVSLGYRF